MLRSLLMPSMIPSFLKIKTKCLQYPGNLETRIILLQLSVYATQSSRAIYNAYVFENWNKMFVICRQLRKLNHSAPASSDLSRIMSLLRCRPRNFSSIGVFYQYSSFVSYRSDVKWGTVRNLGSTEATKIKAIQDPRQHFWRLDIGCRKCPRNCHLTH